jgi:hypothetical protein
VDLTNKQVKLVFLSSSSYPQKTVAKVEVSQEVGDTGVFRVLGTYEIHLDEVFQPSEEPAMLSIINEKLTAIPD